MRPVLLAILDGVGWRTETKDNAYALANAPTIKKYFTEYPNTLLWTHGKHVGLPSQIMGNSEVGHMTIGAGRIYFQDLSKINKFILEGSFFKNETLLKIIRESKRIHLIGLVSDGGVHSHITHLHALTKFLEEENKEYVIHPILDGRDTKPGTCFEFLSEFDSGKFGVISGRYYAMDRDQRWERTESFYDCLTKPNHEVLNISYEEYLKKEALEKRTDEFVKPVLLNQDLQIQPGDGIIFFNFRADRMRQIVRAFFEENFTFFKRYHQGVHLASFTSYEDNFPLPVAFPKDTAEQILGEIISKKNMKQLRIAETEKYAHVTFFFNSGIDKPFEGEIQRLVPSPRDVPTYDLKPEMSADQVGDMFVQTLNENPDLKFAVLNFANGDMVGHTGSLEAAIKAVEAVDRNLKKVLDAWLKLPNALAFITADHGNCELMKDEFGNPHTQHTLNPVKFASTDKSIKFRQDESGLSDIAPTILDVMNIPQPKQMTGKSLVVK